MSDPKGTTRYTYDGTDAAGRTERRGLVTGMSVTRPGTGGDLTYGAAFDIDGEISQEDLPGFVTARTQTNTLGEVTGLSYEGQVTPVTATTADDGTVSWAAGTPTTDTWMAWTQDRDGLGRVTRQYTGAGAAFDGDPGIPEDGDTSHMTVGQGKAHDKEYSYDGLSRLTKVTDREKAAGTGAIDADTKVSGDAACAVRTYTFDANGNRTASSEATHTDGDCAGTTNTSSTSVTMAYDDADRATTGKNGAGSYTYDAFGRQTLMPKADAPNPGAGDVSLAYYLDDSVQKISQGGTDTTFTLDSAGRRKAQTSSSSSGPATTLTRHYTDDSDNPSWVELSGGAIERYTDSVSGMLGAMLDEAGKAKIALIDPNGNTATSIEIPAVNGTDTPATSITDWSTYSEYGQPTTGGTTGTNASSGVLGYGWLGAHQRATTPDTAGLTLMGARVYNNQRGLFTSTDPVYGGNENTYGYPNDPINQSDISGEWGCGGYCSKAWNWTTHHKADIAWTAAGFVPGVGGVTWAYRGYRLYKGVRAVEAGVRAEKTLRSTRGTSRLAGRFWTGRATKSRTNWGGRMYRGKRTYRATSHKSNKRYSGNYSNFNHGKTNIHVKIKRSWFDGVWKMFGW